MNNYDFINEPFFGAAIKIALSQMRLADATLIVECRDHLPVCVRYFPADRPLAAKTIIYDQERYIDLEAEHQKRQEEKENE